MFAYLSPFMSCLPKECTTSDLSLTLIVPLIQLVRWGGVCAVLEQVRKMCFSSFFFFFISHKNVTCRKSIKDDKCVQNEKWEEMKVYYLASWCVPGFCSSTVCVALVLGSGKFQQEIALVFNYSNFRGEINEYAMMDLNLLSGISWRFIWSCLSLPVF